MSKENTHQNISDSISKSQIKLYQNAETILTNRLNESYLVKKLFLVKDPGFPVTYYLALRQSFFLLPDLPSEVLKKHYSKPHFEMTI